MEQTSTETAEKTWHQHLQHFQNTYYNPVHVSKYNQSKPRTGMLNPIPYNNPRI